MQVKNGGIGPARIRSVRLGLQADAGSSSPRARWPDPDGYAD